MGMDVYGKKPKNEKGKYFRNNVWWWHPLWDYIEYAFPEIASKVVYAHTNDGDGLGARDAKLLALKLRNNLKNGKVAEYEKEYHQAVEIGKVQHLQQKQKELKQGSSVEEDSSQEYYWPEYYKFDEENVREFAEFLENCGGFSIC